MHFRIDLMSSSYSIVFGYHCGQLELVTSYSETLSNEYNERIHQMSYSSLSDNGMLQIFSFLIK